MSTPPLLTLRDHSDFANDQHFLNRLAQLQAEELPRVVSRVVKVHQVSVAEAKRWRDQFLRFFALSAQIAGSLVPDRESDWFWHEFLLFTEDYAAFCQRHLGHFLHHSPFDEHSPRGSMAAAVDGASLIASHFAVPPPTGVRQDAPCARPVSTF